MQTQTVAAESVAVVRQGSQIIIPDGMSFDTAIQWLLRRKAEDERKVAIHEEIHGYPLDAAHALAKALSQKYGWVDLVPTPGFFGSTPPAFIGVEVDFGKVDQVPWGTIAIPGVDGVIETGVDKNKDGLPILVLTGVVKQKNQKEVAAIAELTREFLRDHSIYRGNAIRVTFPEPGAKFDPTQCPKFIDTSSVREEELIFTPETKRILNTALFTPVERTQLCRDHKIPLKRGILLEGPYGTGKTLTAYVMAKKCRANRWTFIYLEDIDHLPEAIQFAKQYSPCVVFAEDIDQVLRGERTSDMNSVLNTIDGIEAKKSEIIVVLTTNHVEQINKAMLRPGRLDTVISVRAPDATATTALLKLYSRDRMKPGENLETVGAKLQGQIPAVIREVVERSKLAAVSRMDDQEELYITAVDLMTSAEGMLTHLDLLKTHEVDGETAADKLMKGLSAQFGKHFMPKVDAAVKDAVKAYHESTAAAAANGTGNGVHPEA